MILHQGRIWVLIAIAVAIGNSRNFARRQWGRRIPSSFAPVVGNAQTDEIRFHCRAKVVIANISGQQISCRTIADSKCKSAVIFLSVSGALPRCMTILGLTAYEVALT